MKGHIVSRLDGLRRILRYPHERQRPVRSGRGMLNAAEPEHPQRSDHPADRHGRYEKVPASARRVEVVREDTSDILVFLTNHHGPGAGTIAAIYKDRWQIELFFKALKQNLKIKTFVGTTANAVKIQIWTALISMLLLRYLQLSSRFGWSLANLVALLRVNLFTHRDLMAQWK